jgi:NAD+ synthase (glutamine-hydrolysing)
LLTVRVPGHPQQFERHPGVGRKPGGSLNADYFEITIDELVQQYTRAVEGGIGRKLSWQTDDIALQNIQARVRAPSVWMLANIKGALLLSTSNRSEAAVGYATMDGDTAGSISPIAGIDKAFLRKWLVWLETQGVGGTYKLAGLHKVNSLQPSAELRPLEMTQTDEADLMPYEVLDAIEKCAIRDKQTPREVLEMMHVQFGEVYSATNCCSTWNAFSASGAATSGSGNATPPPSTWTTKTWTPKPGAAGRSSQAASKRS